MKRKLLNLLLLAGLFLAACSKSSDPQPITPDPPQPPPVNPPSSLDDKSLTLGNPSNAVNSLNSPDNYLIDEGYYALSYSRDRGIANWVSWHVQSSDFGSAPRQDDFRASDKIPTTWYRPDYFSYSGYGFDRGHLCPSSDRTSTIEANSSTFLMSNIFPQAPRNNQVTWANLETYCRSLVNQGNELYVIAGSYGLGGTGDQGYATTIDNGRIAVPETTYKIVLVLPNGNNDLSRITTETRVIAVSIPNDNGVVNDWRQYRVPVDSLETVTGYNFLSNVSPAIQDIIEYSVDNL